jgi:hypothetical protein
VSQPAFPDPSIELTPDLSYVFEVLTPAGERLVHVVLPEDVDEVTGPRSPEPSDAEKKRRRQTARLLAEAELRQQWEAALRAAGDGAGRGT